jgi:hypothetical protein
MKLFDWLHKSKKKQLDDIDELLYGTVVGTSEYQYSVLEKLTYISMKCKTVSLTKEGNRNPPIWRLYAICKGLGEDRIFEKRGNFFTKLIDDTFSDLKRFEEHCCSISRRNK